MKQTQLIKAVQYQVNRKIENCSIGQIWCKDKDPKDCIQCTVIMHCVHGHYEQDFICEQPCPVLNGEFCQCTG